MAMDDDSGTDSDSSDCVGTGGFAGALFTVSDSDTDTDGASDAGDAVAVTEVIEYTTPKHNVVKVTQRKALGIGHQVWPAATALTTYLAANPLPGDAAVLELGAGVGLVSLTTKNYY